jgi:hypothetical protein
MPTRDWDECDSFGVVADLLYIAWNKEIKLINKPGGEDG